MVSFAKMLCSYCYVEGSFWWYGFILANVERSQLGQCEVPRFLLFSPAPMQFCWLLYLHKIFLSASNVYILLILCNIVYTNFEEVFSYQTILYWMFSYEIFLRKFTFQSRNVVNILYLIKFKQIIIHGMIYNKPWLTYFDITCIYFMSHS